MLSDRSTLEVALELDDSFLNASPLSDSGTAPPLGGVSDEPMSNANVGFVDELLFPTATLGDGLGGTVGTNEVESPEFVGGSGEVASGVTDSEGIFPGKKAPGAVSAGLGVGLSVGLGANGPVAVGSGGGNTGLGGDKGSATGGEGAGNAGGGEVGTTEPGSFCDFTGEDAPPEPKTERVVNVSGSSKAGAATSEVRNGFVE